MRDFIMMMLIIIRMFVSFLMLYCCIAKDYCSASQIERARQLQQLWDAQVQASVTSASATSAHSQPTWNWTVI